MKITKLILCLTLTLSTAIQAQSGFTVQQAEDDFEMNSFQDMSGVQVIKIDDKRGESKSLPDSELVYQLVRAHTSFELTKDWDQLDYDRFYMRLHSIKTQDLIKIYKGLTSDQVEKLKADFKKYE